MATLAPAACDTRPDSPSCSAFYIAGRLGHRDRSWTWVKAQIEALQANEGFPPPIILYSCTAPKPARVAGLTPSSRWNRAAVDAWFDGQPSAMVPARLIETASEAFAGHYANDLDARAAALAGNGA